MARAVRWRGNSCPMSRRISGSRAGCERVPQGRGAEAMVQGDDAVARHHAEARLAIGNIARKLHSRLHGARAAASVAFPLTSFRVPNESVLCVGRNSEAYCAMTRR